MTPTGPIFSIGDDFPATVMVGRVFNEHGGVILDGTPLPIHVKRLSRPELDAFEKKWDGLINPRGDLSSLTEAEVAAREAEQLAFFEASIRDYVTVDEGLLVNRGKPVTDGAGVIDMFYARKDVLSSLLVAIFTQNRLAGVIGKNSNSPRDSGTGSARSIQPRGGDAPDSTADSVAPFSSAATGDATDVSRTASSGEPSGATAVL